MYEPIYSYYKWYHPTFLARECIKNWDEINISLKRNDFSGIIRSFSSKFEFTEYAYSLLLNEYRINYLNANAQIEVYTFDNNKSKKYLYGNYLVSWFIRV